LPNGKYRIRPRDQSENGCALHSTPNTKQPKKKSVIESAFSKNEYVPSAEIPTVKEAATDWLNGKKVAPSSQQTCVSDFQTDPTAIKRRNGPELKCPFNPVTFHEKRCPNQPQPGHFLDNFYPVGWLTT